MQEKIRISVDECEGDTLVCIRDDNGETLLLSRADAPALVPRDIADIILEDSRVISVTPLPEEREARLARNRARLEALRRRGK